jgi:hypothetical protein
MPPMERILAKVMSVQNVVVFVSDYGAPSPSSLYLSAKLCIS